MSLIFPLLLAFMLSFNVKTEAQVKEKTKVVVNNVQFIPEILKSVIITSATTKDQLKEVAREFKKLGVELQFKKLKFSKEGLLTRINIKYEIEKTGDSGSLIKDGDTAIDDIEISLFEDFNIEIRSLQTMKEKNDYVVVSDSNSVAIGSIARPKKRVWKTNLDDVTMERVMYTSSSKNNTKGTFSVGNKVRYYPTENDTINGKGTIMNVRTKNGNQIKWTDGDKDSIKHKYRIIVLDSSNTNTSNISKNIKVVSKGNNDKPLYIINGEIEMDESKATSINPDNVENVYVIKNASAIKKYGAKGRNGVVKINTKNNKLFRIKATTTDEELEDLKRRVAATTDFQLSLNSIERNKEGLISKINIKFSGNSGKMVSGNYSELDGIADIYVGQKEDGGVIIYSN